VEGIPDNWLAPAIIDLNKKKLKVSFDELSHDCHRYTYHNIGIAPPTDIPMSLKQIITSMIRIRMDII